MDKLLTLREVAELLQVNERTALRLAHAGDLPAARVGGQWRVHPVELERWFLDSKAAENGTPAADVSDLFSCGNVLLDSGCSTVDDVLGAIAEHLAKSGQLIYPTIYQGALKEREQMLSTGVGKGVAIPHARHSINGLFRSPLCVFMRLGEPIDFGAVDGHPVDLVFAVAAPNNETHLESLARIMHFARDESVRQALRDAPDSAAICSVLRPDA